MVDDILNLVDECIPKEKRLKPGQLTWLAVAIEDKHTQGKKLKDTKLIPVKLTLTDDTEINDYIKGTEMKEIRKKRIERLLYETKKQGGVLAQKDLAVLMGVHTSTIASLLKELQVKQGLSPTQGTVHNLGPTLTHKRQIIELYEQGYLELEIARKAKHALLNVDAYLKDYKRVKLLVDKSMKEDERR